MTIDRQEDVPSQFITRTADGTSPILQRVKDGYINATALCKACGKQVNDYLRLTSTKEFLDAMEAETGIPVSGLVEIRKGGTPHEQGTWVHPHVAINLAQWSSPQFAVKVASWVYEWMRGELVERPKPLDNPFELIIQQAQASLDLQKRQMALDQRQTATEQTVKGLSARLEALEDKAEHLFGGRECYTIRGYGRRQGKTIPNSLLRELEEEATQLCREKYYPIGQASDEVWGYVNSYPEEILSVVFFNYNLLKSSDAEA